MTPHPLLVIIVEPKSIDDSRRLTDALRVMSAEDPAISSAPHVDPAVVIGVNSEEQLETIVDRLAREFHVAANLSPVHVACKQTLLHPTEAEGRFVSQLAGRGQYGQVRLRVIPRARGEGNVFADQTVFGSIPRQFMASIEEGVKQALSQSPPGGYAVDDVEVVVYDGSYHETDSSQLAFNEAARRAVHHALDKGGPVLLEPIMRVRVTVPPAHVSAVVRDLLDRRAQIHSRADDQLDAEAPLMELLGYASWLRGMCRGAARMTMEFDRYEVRKPGTSGEDGGAGVREPRAPFPSPPKPRAASIDP